MKKLEVGPIAPDLNLPDRTEDVRSLVVRISKVRDLTGFKEI